MSKHRHRALASLVALAAFVAWAGGCNDIVGVDFGAVHAADGGGAPEGGGSSCTPKACGALALSCGAQDDGCHNVIDCGGCDAGQACSGGHCACVPTTCPALGVQCGTVDDGCNHVLACGNCTTANQACQNGNCVCTPQSCSDQAAECGTVPDGCGGTYDCGACQPDSGAEFCGGQGPNKCGSTPCTPITCQVDGGTHCGAMSDNCGGVLNCPDCTAPATCGGVGTPNVCGCAPTTCAAQGLDCGSIPDGCGGMLQCGTCTSPQSCAGGGAANVCGCTPTSCAALNATCGALADGCGGTLDCGSCTGLSSCGGGGVPNACGCTPDCDPDCSCGGPNGCGGMCPKDPVCCGEGCFVRGTSIEMANGTLEPIESVHPGELVRSYEEASDTFVSAKVIEALRHDESFSARGIVIVNGQLRVTPNHPIWVDGRRVRADELDLGTPILLLSRSPDGHAQSRRELVRSLELAAGDIPTFDLRVAGPGNYVADGIVVFIKEDADAKVRNLGPTAPFDP